jgi:hypothetical protein
MPGNLAVVGAIEVEAETSFAEDVTTFATFRVPHKGMVDVSGLKQGSIDPQRLTQYINEQSKQFRGVFSGTFTTTFYIPGHGSTTSGATTVTALETFLAAIIGGGQVSITAGTTFAAGGTAGAPKTTVVNGFASGSGGRAGVLGDGRGNGQFFAVDSHATSTLNLLTALDNAPAAADVCYSAYTVYPYENPIAAPAVPSYRMRVKTSNLCVEAHGCIPTSYKLTGWNAGEYLTIEVTWTPAWWRYTASTLPSSVATDSSLGAPVAAGSLFLQAVGTSTRVKLTGLRSFSFDAAPSVQVLTGQGGVNAYQTIVGARRDRGTYKVTLTVDADDATATPALDTYWQNNTPLHLLYTLNTTAGSAVGLYCPNMFVTGDRPIQKADGNSNHYTIELTCSTGPTTTNDLTSSAWRLFLA